MDNNFTPVLEGLEFDDEVFKDTENPTPQNTDDNDDNDGLKDDDFVVQLSDDLDLGDSGDSDDDPDDDADKAFQNLFKQSQSAELTEDVLVTGTSKLLQDIGLFTLAEGEEIKSLDDLEGILKERAGETILSSFIDETPDLGKDVISFILNKGENLTKEDLTAFYATYLNELDISELSFDDNSISQARDYLEVKYKEKGLRPSVIKTSLDALEVDGTLLEEANALLDKDKAASATKKSVTESKQERENRLKSEREFVSSVTNTIKTSNWKPEKMQKVASIIKNGEIVDFANSALNDPDLMVKFAEVLTYYNAEKKEFDFTPVAKKEATKEIENTKNSLFRDFLQSKGTSKTSQDTTEGKTPQKKASFRTI